MNLPPPSADPDTVKRYLDAQPPHPADPERVRQLRALGVEPDALPSGARRLLLENYASPPAVAPVDRDLRTVVLALRRRGLTPEAITRAVGASALAQPIRALGADLDLSVLEALGAAERDLERARRPGENFTVLAVERIEHAATPSFGLLIERDDRPGGRFEVDVRWSDLESMWRFQSRLVREIGLMPLLKPDYRGERFGAFAALIVNSTDTPACKPDHGKLHGRPARTPETDDLVVQAIKSFVVEAGGYWQGRATPLYARVTEHARRLGELPLDFPGTPTALAYGFRRYGGSVTASGIDWRRHMSTGRKSAPLYTFRVRAESKPPRAA